MITTDAETRARALYDALAAGNADALADLLDPDVVVEPTAGLPGDLGEVRHGRDAAIQGFWWAIGRRYAARAEPERFLPTDDGALVVLGRYRGTARDGGGELDAAFAHVLRFAADGRIAALTQYTDSTAWGEALPAPDRPRAGEREMRRLSYTVDSHGVATIRLVRPKAGNAIDPRFTEDLDEATFRAAEDPAVRAVLLCADGPRFCVGGDLAVLGELEPAALPVVLRQMIDTYHQALERLTEIDAPVVAAVRGAAAGGGLGLLHVSDVVVIDEAASLAIGYAALGLVADGLNTWYLPRTVGLRRAQELFLLNRPFSGAEAVAWGLATEAVPADDVDERGRALAERLAAGPTRAFGRMKRLLRESHNTALPVQARAEITAMTDAAADEDAAAGVPAFRAGQRPVFHGR
ncbi:enoyl-CoA hydratase-related protein [Actinomycetospora endophytica]|uniref:Enoyl-CoA hydratase-related protein n=1 Tax=Actinomycetospora endophytica TaxID=2291215 RepID=A0ABS8P9B0_9PSEU|nr:enoyl-CoA hydratase-related protein [Actinomycetospora endophytica]MCD2194608.1 enoyl-CoA hydratase-related protein [Actinomycetospora endophytica]